MNIYKKWYLCTLSITLTILLALALPTIIIDPYFHYHHPVSSLQYILNNERYQNDGIIKHFEYNAVITGTSMIENFKSSEFDMLFNVNSIKVPFSGATYKEINNNLETAIKYNSDIKIILRCLDYRQLMLEKDSMRYDAYPTYLYDNQIFNDTSYILNKSVLFNDTLSTIKFTNAGGLTTSFDDYANWMDAYIFGKNAILETYVRPTNNSQIIEFSANDRKNIYENLTQNVIALVNENPEIDFYLFFSPYSIIYWDSLNQSGNIYRQLQAEKYAIELLLQCENIYLFSFNNNFELVCNLNNYKDYTHYGEHINSQILFWICNNDYLLTPNNYVDYYNAVYNFYTTYDYDSIFEK